MQGETAHLKVKLVLGSITLFVGILAANLALFHWIERTGLYHLLGEYARYVCAYGGFAAMIFGAMLINDFLVLTKALKKRAEDELTISSDIEKEEEKRKASDTKHKNKGQKTAAIPLAIFLFTLSIYPFVASSLMSYTATVIITPELETVKNEYIWISGNDDFVRKLNKSDPGGPQILSWDTGTSYPFGCEYRIEDGNEYIYIVDYREKPDALIKFHANNGTEVTRWDISGYSSNAYGLAWNGSRWFIADGVNDLIYQADPANPTVAERSFSYSGIVECEGLAWDGSYLWAVDSGTDKVYQIDIYGNIQTSWDFAPTDPSGIAYDTTSGHLWIARDNTEPYYLYEYYTNGTEINNWDPSGIMPQGVAYASVDA